MKEARELLSTGLTKDDQAEVDVETDDSNYDYLKAIDKFCSSEHNRVEDPKNPPNTEPRKVVSAVVVKEKPAEPVKPIETKPSEPV